MAATKLLRALVKKAKKAPKKKLDSKQLAKLSKKPKPTYASEMKALKGKAMTDAARKAEAKRIAKKYLRK
jgi:hypothetical protein